MKKTSPNAKAPAKAPVAKDTRNGVDKIIDYLNKNREHIGAIVIAACAKSGKQMPRFPNGDGKTDGFTASADLIQAANADERISAGIRSPVTSGLAIHIKNMLLDKTGPFG